jgi:protease inhibitor Inh
MTIRSRPATLLGALLMLAGCAGDRMTGLFSTSRQEPAHTGSIRPQVDMSGRWILVSPGRGQCNMNFGGGPAAPNGGIAPEGGCPGNFYTSRNWNFEQAGLILRDHTGAPLGQLSAAGHARFDGRSIAGEPITLYR